MNLIYMSLNGCIRDIRFNRHIFIHDLIFDSLFLNFYYFQFRLPTNSVTFGKILNFWWNISNFPINVYMLVEYSRCTNKNIGVE